MRRFFLLVLFFFLIFFPLTKVFSQEERLATCDLCGYCQGKTPPQNWQSCRACLYPNASSQPTAGDTLRVNPTINLPPTPYPGRWYTFLGCINTNLGSFENPQAAGVVVQLLLNIIFSLVGGASFISFIYGAFLLLTSQSNPEKINQGKKVIFEAIAGLIFALSAVFLVNFIGERVLLIPGFTQSVPTP